MSSLVSSIQASDGASYVDQLELIAKGFMGNYYFDHDFLKIDKPALNDFAGSAFVWACRETGTHLATFEAQGLYPYPEAEQDMKVKHHQGGDVYSHKFKAYKEERVRMLEDTMFAANNKHFYIGQKGIVKKVSAQKAREFIQSNVNFKTRIFF